MLLFLLFSNTHKKHTNNWCGFHRVVIGKTGIKNWSIMGPSRDAKSCNNNVNTCNLLTMCLADNTKHTGDKKKCSFLHHHFSNVLVMGGWKCWWKGFAFVNSMSFEHGLEWRGCGQWVQWDQRRRGPGVLLTSTCLAQSTTEKTVRVQDESCSKAVLATGH